MSDNKSNFAKAVELANQRWLESLPNPEDIPEFEHSEEYDTIMKMIISGEINSEEDLKEARKRFRGKQ